jgi:hypothetical protein
VFCSEPTAGRITARAFGLWRQPLVDDVFDFLGFQRFMGEQVVSQCCQGGPEVLAVQQTVEIRSGSFEAGQSFLLIRIQHRRGFPGFRPVGGPLRDHAGVKRVAGVKHLGNRSGQRHENPFLLIFPFRQAGRVPENLRVTKPFRSVVPVRIDRDRVNFGSDMHSHQRMAGFVVSGDFHRVVVSLAGIVINVACLDDDDRLTSGLRGAVNNAALPEVRKSLRTMEKFRIVITLLPMLLLQAVATQAADDATGTAFFEKRIRPLLVKHCYECHSEEAEERQGGLLLDRRSGWIEGGDTTKAVIPGEPEASLLIKAVRYSDENLQMPPDGKLEPEQIKLLEQWVRLGAPGPQNDPGETEFSRLGDQVHLFEQAENHWAFQPVKPPTPPAANRKSWNGNAIDQFVFARLAAAGLAPSDAADPRTLIRRLTFDLTGLPPSMNDVNQFAEQAAASRTSAIDHAVDRLIDSPAFGEHLGRMWLDVARYADTDSSYRPDTRTPHYYPFAFTYRDYVVDALNRDKPFNDFVKEQFAADLIGFKPGDPELAALGFLAAGPFANRDQPETMDDLIDVTTRGFLGITVACARCHDHKYEPVPTKDYYSLRGVFASVVRVNPLDEDKQPLVPGYEPLPADLADYEVKRAKIDAQVAESGNSKSKNNNQSISEKIRETELAELLLFHPGAPARAMRVIERPRPLEPVVFIRGDDKSPGEQVPRRFLKIIDPEQSPFPDDSSGRLQLAERIVDPQNPLTARVFVNRVWGYLMGSHLVDTPSDFGLQGSTPTHPELLDWLANDFVQNGWSIKRLVRLIVSSQTYQQRSDHREDAAEVDSLNQLLWRANRKHLAIEAIRDSLLSVSQQLDSTPRGRAGQLWSEGYTRRRAIYGYINRFNLDPTLRAFDFPTPVQSQSKRGESIVAPQTLFTMNSPFVIDQTVAITGTPEFQECDIDEDRVTALFELILQRPPAPLEVERVLSFVELQSRFTTPKDKSRRASTWPLVAQSLMMSNEFQYID